MKYPLIGIAIAFASGILVSAHLEISFFVLYILALLFLATGISFIKQNKIFSASILCVFFLLGLLLLKNSERLSADHIARFTPYRGEAARLTGVVDDDPAFGKKSTSFILRPLMIERAGEKKAVSGKVLVRVYEKKDFLYGDKLVLEGKLFRPYSMSGDFDYREYLKHKGIYSLFNVKKDASLKKLGSSPRNLIKEFAFKVRHRVKAVFDKNLSIESAGILNAIIIGQRQNLPPEVKDNLIKSGSVHIIAISGLHVGIAAFIVLALLKIMAVLRKPRYLLAIAFLIIYCLLTGSRIPVLRATIMAVIMLLGYVLEREVNIYNSLALAALIILAFNPWQIFEISFRLSFLSIISIVWLAPKIKALFPEHLLKVRWLNFLIIAFSVSSAAWLGLMPLIAYYFRIISPVTVLANIIVVPYMTVIVASGFCMALAGMVSPFLASLLGGGCEVFIILLVKISSFFASIPGAYFKIPRVPVAYIFIYYTLLISGFLSLTRRGVKKSF